MSREPNTLQNAQYGASDPDQVPTQPLEEAGKTLTGAQNTPSGRLDHPDPQKSNTGVPWKPLEPSWRNQHGQFGQIWRQGDVAIFEQHRNGLLIAYEVIIVQKIPDHEAFGKFYPAHEAYPSFGKVWEPNGWSFGRQHRERVFEFARQLLQNLKLPAKERVSSVELLTANKEVERERLSTTQG